MSQDYTILRPSTLFRRKRLTPPRAPATTGVAASRTPGPTRIWAVGGGKGGIGKSFLAANLGAYLSRMGKRVVLIDADLGGANLHTCLGLPFPEQTLGDFITRRVTDLSKVVVKTEIPNLSLISGAFDFLGAANPKHMQKMRVLRGLKQLDVDYVIVDLGTGTSYNTLDFFLISDHGVLVVVPEPTSIENVYAFIKAAYYRRLKRTAKHMRIRELLDTALDSKNRLGMRTPVQVLKHIRSIDPAYSKQLKDEINRFQPKLIMNMVRTSADIRMGFSIRSVCRKYFGINLDYLGYINYDNSIWRAVKRRKLLLTEFPQSESAEYLGRIAKKLVRSEPGDGKRGSS